MLKLVQKSITNKIIVSSVLISVVTAILIGGVSLWRTDSFSRFATEAVTVENQGKIDSQIQGIHTTMQSIDETLQIQLQGNLNVARQQLAGAGGLRFVEGITAWTATSQDDGKSVTVNLPAAAIGSYPLTPQTAAAAVVPAVDSTTNLVGGAVTIFQRMNQEGDMLRVATNVKSADGSRAFGTYIPHLKTDGKPNKIIETVLAGETYTGVAKVVGAWYVVVYEPILVNQQVQGILFVGLRQDSIPALQTAVTKQVFGVNGYASLVGASADNLGVTRLSGNPDEVGKNLTESTDGEDKSYVATAIETAVENAGEIASIPYLHPEKGPSTLKALYFSPWDVVVLGHIVNADFENSIKEIRGASTAMALWIFITLVVALIIAVIAASWVGRSLAHPIVSLQKQTSDIVSGTIDLSREVNVKVHDEVGVLAETINYLISRVNDTIVKVGRQAKAVSTVAQAISGQSEKMGETAKRSAREVEIVQESSNEILESINTAALATDELNQAIAEISTSASQALDVATRAQDLAKENAQSIEKLNAASNDVGNVLSLISGIAEQTNLLALNATIESARAGDAGKGFAVVAGEVKDLAGQTSTATEKSSEHINAIQELSENVSESMNRIHDVIVKINEFQTQIAAAVEEQSATTNTVRGGVNSMVDQVKEITQSLQAVTEASQDTMEKAVQTSDAATQLSEASQALKTELEAFQVREDNEDNSESDS